MYLRIFAFLIGFIILALDAGTKFAVHTHLPLMNYSSYIYPYGGIPVFEDISGVEFAIVHAVNYGAAWGMFSGFPHMLLTIRFAMIIGISSYLAFFNKSRLLIIPLTLVLAGAIGNVIDHFLYGHVIDMFHFVLWGYDYPVFNIADSAICVGIFATAFLSSFFDTDEPRATDEPHS